MGTEHFSTCICVFLIYFLNVWYYWFTHKDILASALRNHQNMYIKLWTRCYCQRKLHTMWPPYCSKCTTQRRWNEVQVRKGEQRYLPTCFFPCFGRLSWCKISLSSFIRKYASLSCEEEWKRSTLKWQKQFIWHNVHMDWALKPNYQSWDISRTSLMDTCVWS
jgi:hypothetical protein